MSHLMKYTYEEMLTMFNKKANGSPDVLVIGRLSVTQASDLVQTIYKVEPWVERAMTIDKWETCPDERHFKGDFMTYDFGSQKFDAIAMDFSTVKFFTDREELLKRVSGLLKPAGMYMDEVSDNIVQRRKDAEIILTNRATMNNLNIREVEDLRDREVHDAESRATSCFCNKFLAAFHVGDAYPLYTDMPATQYSATIIYGGIKDFARRKQIV